MPDRRGRAGPCVEAAAAGCHEEGGEKGVSDFGRIFAVEERGTDGPW